ncbi:MAG: ATP-dependent DNA helicase RecG [candidate division WOR-3 bacterium]
MMPQLSGKFAKWKDVEFDLNSPVQYLKGVGPKRAYYFKKIGIEKIKDLIFLLPRRYLDRKNLRPIRELKVGEEGTVIGKVLASGVEKTLKKGEVVRIAVGDQTGILYVTWFNRPDLKNTFRINQEVILSGPVSYFRGKSMVNPYYEIMEEGKEEYNYCGAIIPIYPLTENLSLWDIRRTMRQALQIAQPLLRETLPKKILKNYSFPSLPATLNSLHFPETMEETIKARERLVYEEFFYFECLLALNKKRKKEDAPILSNQERLTKSFLSLLPFPLTQSQREVIKEIEDDLQKGKSMTRLLQGDVGSGKTVVALYAMVLACENETQACLMAPTEILAEQHFLNWHPLLAKIGIKSALLTGSTKKKEKIYEGLAKGEIGIVFGTHALIEEDCRFKNLALVIVDEQHRFGVMQRAKLLTKGKSPHFLVMTATPIPRTLSLTLYGDLDISTLKEKPPGRKRIVTRLTSEGKRDKVYDFIKGKLKEGRQVYILCPLIEESEKLDLASAKKTYEEVKIIFNDFSVALLHGRMKSEERMKTMEDFRKGLIQILVTTTVIEVGVDVPNATIILIEHPERFGLAQLHQLRGRVGRGEEVSYCILLAPENISPEAKERLTHFEKMDDGFLLAEKDLELRGPGQFFGVRQHGLPDFKIGDPIKEKEILFRAREDAFAIIEEDPNLEKEENWVIRENIPKRFLAREDLLKVI